MGDCSLFMDFGILGFCIVDRSALSNCIERNYLLIVGVLLRNPTSCERLMFVNESIIAPTALVENLPDLMAFAGIGCGLWGETADDVEASIADLKSGWER